MPWFGKKNEEEQAAYRPLRPPVPLSGQEESARYQLETTLTYASSKELLARTLGIDEEFARTPEGLYSRYKGIHLMFYDNEIPEKVREERRLTNRVAFPMGTRLVVAGDDRERFYECIGWLGVHLKVFQIT